MIYIRTKYQTKKNCCGEVYWGVTQDRPYPTLDIRCDEVKWVNTSPITTMGSCDLLPLEPRYTAYMMRLDFNPDNPPDKDMEFSSSNFAGYKGYQSPYHREASNNGIILRGEELGEIRADIQLDGRRCNHRYATFKGWSTEGQRKWLNSEFEGQLIVAVSAFKVELLQEAVKYMKEGMEKRLASCAESIKLAYSRLDELCEAAGNVDP